MRYTADNKGDIMRIIFIRHGQTPSNAEKRYISRTDESLSDIGKEMLGKPYPDCDIVVCSPMKRCIETADVIYPDKRRITDNELTECDFGSFEGKNYHDLSGDGYYQKWIDSGGTLPFPGGEAPESFKNRIYSAFLRIVNELSGYDTISFIVHSGNIMSVLERFAEPHRDYFSYAPDNGCGYVCTYENGVIDILGKI